MLKQEAPTADELNGLKESGLSRMRDAEREELSFASRFDLAYNAAHALSLYALRRAGFRPKRRYVVFQALRETAGMSAPHWRIMLKAHDVRNFAEYEGHLERDEQLLEDLLKATHLLESALFEER
jgi:hypothetical protein